MPRKPNPVSQMTGVVKLDTLLSSWRKLLPAVKKLKLKEIEQMIQAEQRRVPPRESIMNKLVARYGTLQKRNIRIPRVRETGNDSNARLRD